MNTGYAKEIILKSFYHIVKENLLNNFVYEEDTDDNLMKEAERFGIEDLSKPLRYFEINASELRSLLLDLDNTFGVELDEEKYWIPGNNNCIVKRCDSEKNAFLGMMAMLDTDTQLLPNLTFQIIADDLIDLVMEKLQ